MSTDQAQWHVHAARYTCELTEKEKLEHIFNALDQLVEAVQRLEREVRSQK